MKVFRTALALTLAATAVAACSEDEATAPVATNPYAGTYVASTAAFHYTDNSGAAHTEDLLGTTGVFSITVNEDSTFETHYTDLNGATMNQTGTVAVGDSTMTFSAPLVDATQTSGATYSFTTGANGELTLERQGSFVVNSGPVTGTYQLALSPQ